MTLRLPLALCLFASIGVCQYSPFAYAHIKNVTTDMGGKSCQADDKLIYFNTTDGLKWACGQDGNYHVIDVPIVTTVNGQSGAVTVSGGGSSTWGSITGTLSSQTDLNTALSGKQATGNYITALTGDVTASGAGSDAATLATVNSGPGSCGDASHVCQATTNGKGLVTSQSAVLIAIASGAVSGLAPSATTDATNLSNDTSGSVNLSLVNYQDSTTTHIFEDFLPNSSTSGSIGNYGWAFLAIGGAPTVGNAASTWNHPGIETMTTSTTSAQGGYFYIGANYNSLLIGANAPWKSEWIAEISTVSTVASRLGFGNGLGAKVPTVAGIYFRYDTALSDTAWMACVNNTGTETCTTTGVAPTTGFTDLFISSSVAGTVSFAVGNSTPVTICASACTATATPPTGVMDPTAGIVTLTTAAAVLSVDLFVFQATGLTR